MRVSRRFLSLVVAVLVFGCETDNSIGPRVAPDFDARVNAAISSLGVLPGAARAKAKVYCDGTTCYAAAFDFTEDRDPSGPLTLFTVYFQNLQGSYPLGGSSTPLTLGFFRFDFLGSTAPEDPFVDAIVASFSTVGNVQVGDYHVWAGNSSQDPERIRPNSDFWIVSYPAGIVGCNVEPLNPPNWFSYRTCPSQGLDGWVKIEIPLRRKTGAIAGTLSTPIRPPVRFDDFRFTFGSVFGARCTIGGDQAGTCTELSYRSVMRQ